MGPQSVGKGGWEVGALEVEVGKFSVIVRSVMHGDMV